jgi:hypothetical protein
MIKSSILDFRTYQISFKNSVKSKWTPLLILFPVALYLFYRIFESQVLAELVAIMPNDPEKSIGFYKDLLWLTFNEVLWLTGYFAFAWLFVLYMPLFKLAQAIEHQFLDHHHLIATMIISTSFAASIIISKQTLQTFPNSSDEYVYLYQASTMSKGKLWESAHDLPDFFFFNHVKQKDGISVGRFPPGWPAILSVAYFIGLPVYLVNPFLGLITLIVFYHFTKRFFGMRVALWSLIILALSSFYIFNSASYFSHTSCLLFTLGFVYSIYSYKECPKILYALIAGFCLGMIAITRYYTAILIFIPFFFFLIYLYRWESVRLFLWMAIGAVPCLAFLMWYNYSITGNSLLPVTMWGYNDEGLGFVRGHTVFIGVEHIIRRILMFLYWSSPGLLILYFVFLIRKLLSKTEALTHPEDYIFALLMIGYFFYYQIGGNQYGPRFFFEALPFMVVFVVRKVFEYKINWSLALVFAGIVYALVKLPFIAERENQVITERNDLYNVTEKSKISNAVVFISSSTGLIRPMPVGDLTRNDPYFSNDILYVRDLGANNKLLIEYYPDRKFYKYVRARESVHGKLVRVK